MGIGADKLNEYQRRSALPGSEWYEDANGNSTTFQNFAPRWIEAVNAGLMSAALVYRANLRRKLRHGYTTGRFATGKAADSLRIMRPRVDRRDGVPTARVFTHDFKQRIWEMGAFNAFTHHYERKEYWRETMTESGEEMTTAFHAAFARTLG